MAKKENKVKKTILKPAEELFCKLYSGTGDYFNNATRSYAVAYSKELPTPEKCKSDWNKREANEYNKASVDAHNLLRKPNIRARCDEILLEQFDDRFIDTELSWVIKQKKDLSSKVRAISEYNKLKKRVVERLDVVNFTLNDKEKEKMDEFLKLNKHE